MTDFPDIPRKRRLELNHYARFRSGYCHVMSSPAELRADLLEGNERRQSKLESVEVEYVVQAIKREHRLHLCLLRSVGI